MDVTNAARTAHAAAATQTNLIFLLPVLSLASIADALTDSKRFSESSKRQGVVRSFAAIPRMGRPPRIRDTPPPAGGLHIRYEAIESTI
jgi:hypothetical protein